MGRQSRRIWVGDPASLDPTEEIDIYPFVFVTGKNTTELDFLAGWLENLGFRYEIDQPTGTLTITGNTL